MRSFSHPSTPRQPCRFLLTSCTFILLLQAATAFALPRDSHQQHRRHLPTPLHRHPRGGYVRTKKEPRRNWFGISASLSTSAATAAPAKPLPKTTSTTPGNNASPAPIPWKRLGNNNDTEGGDLDMLFQTRQEELQNNHYPPQRQPQQQQDQELISYVEELKQQVTRASEDAAVGDTTSTKKKGRFSLSRLDVTLFGTYFCHSVAMTLPIVLLPMVAAEHVATNSHLNLSVAAVVATIASVSTFGCGIGKCLNGFVCQSLGGSRSSSLYLVGWAAASFLLSKSSAGNAGWIMFFMEFLASIQWTACSLVLANHYAERSPNKFSKGITILSLASTTGMITAKTGGTALLKYFDNSWRAVAQVGSLAALIGAAIMRLAAEHPEDKRSSSSQQSIQKKSGPGPKEALKSVLGSPLFWQVGIAHATAMLARTCDRVLGAFFHQTTALPRSVCGGLTAFVTLGFVHGLTKGRQFNALQDIQAKTDMLSKCYSASALSAVAMALCANEWVQSVFFPSQKILAATVAALTGVLASNISFQFYQIPAITAAAFFGKNKALCLSLFDAMGFLFAAPVWAMVGKIVEGAGPYGWTLAWFMLAGMFAAGGKTMLTALPSVLHRQQQQIRKAASA